ncbi:MAG: hypothetical protein QNJ16_09065 [Rhodobacter sp.]|nr:hypothetical protein [Rhodobacter sp.]
MSYPFDLGGYTRPVTRVAEAQPWFDRGLVWLFGYNHDEAIVCFERCLTADPDCALARWGIAYALGPNYNKPWEVFTEAEKAPCLARAHAELAAATPRTAVEADLIAALKTRYPADAAVEDVHPWTNAFADAMRQVHAAHPDDLDVTFVFAEALMNRTPWQLWDLATGAPTKHSAGPEAKALLDRAFERPEAWDHPGLLHMFIHLMEMSPTPEAALRHGDRLTGLVPDAGHLVHMATHIDVLTGDYQAVVTRNLAAAEVDARFKDYAGGANFYALYRIHNLHFAVYGAMFLAQPSVALDAARRLRAEVPDDVVRVYPDLFEAFVATRPHVLIRFGMWREILDEPIPEDTELYAFTQALIFYARAVALANLGRGAEAQVEADRFHAARAAIPDTRMLFQNKAQDVLGVAEAMMLGEVAYKAGRIDEGLDHLREAVRRDDGLMYEEPWAWPQPARHALGALLIDAGHWDEAEAVFRADLGLDPTLPRALQNPANVWALHGLDECLTRRGEEVEQRHVRRQLDIALARAEVPVKASCYCRTRVA